LLTLLSRIDAEADVVAGRLERLTGVGEYAEVEGGACARFAKPIPAPPLRTWSPLPLMGSFGRSVLQTRPPHHKRSIAILHIGGLLVIFN
jgi:hypothetical protein